MTIPYLNPVTVQAEARMVLTFLGPIVSLLPGTLGNTILAVANGLANDSALVAVVCDAVNKFSGSTPTPTS